jgi:hypothetical protein
MARFSTTFSSPVLKTWVVGRRWRARLDALQGVVAGSKESGSPHSDGLGSELGGENDFRDSQ